MKRAIAMLLSCVLFVSSIPGSALAKEEAAKKLTPQDMNFRKVWTARNMFSSQVTLDQMNFSEIQEGMLGNLQFQATQDEQLEINNVGEEPASDRVLLGEHTPYGAYDVEVTEQKPGTDVKLELVKDEDNKIVVTQTNMGTSGERPVFKELISALDMGDSDLLTKTGVYDDNPPYNKVSKIENGIRFEGGTGRGESFVPVAPLVQGHIYEATVGAQTNGYANVILKLRKDNKNAVFFVLRTNGDCSFEVFKNGSSVKTGSFKTVSTEKPKTMSMEINGQSIIFSSASGTAQEFSQEVNIGEIFDLANPEVLKDFQFVIGGRIDPGQKVEFTSAKEYEMTDGETVLDTSDLGALTKYDDVAGSDGGVLALANPDGQLSFQWEEQGEQQRTSLDMEDAALLEKTGIYDDNPPYNKISKIEGGIRFEGGTGRGESFVPVAPAMQNYGYEAVISEQTSGYANLIVKLRKDNKNAIFFVQKPDGSLSYEVFKDGTSRTGSKSLGKADPAARPYTMHMEIQGENVVFKQITGGRETVSKSVSVKEFFDLTNPAVLEQFQFVIGGRLDPNQSVIFTEAKAFELPSSGARESFVPVSRLRQGLVYEVTVNAQDNQENSSNAYALAEFRLDKDNRILLVSKPDGTMLYEMYKTGFQGAQNRGTLANTNPIKPYKLRMEVQGNLILISRVDMEGNLLANVTYDVSDKFDLTNPAVTENMEFAIGARCVGEGAVTFTNARVWYNEPVSGADSHNGQLKLEVYRDGKRVVNRVIESGEFTVPYTLRADFSAKPNVNGTTVGTGQGLVNIWRVVDGKAVLPAGNTTIDFDLGTDFSNPEVVGQYQAYLGVSAKAGTGAKVSQVSHYLTGGAGQADPKPLHNQKGEILQEDGKIWMAMTTRGYSINSSYQGIYELNLKTNELTLVGSMSFNLGQNGERRYGGYHAADIIYNEPEDEWIVMTTSHVNNHQVNSGVLEQDPRETAFQFVDVRKVDYPGSVKNEEDASLIFDEEVGKWRLVMCMAGAGGYQLPMFEADTWDGTYREIGRSAEVPCTGIQIQKVDGQYYIFFGRGTDNCEALYYPQMTKAANLKIQSSPRSYNVWPVMIPLKDEEAGTTRYFMLSFDRDAHTNQHSYGNLFLYEAEQYEGMIPPVKDESVQDTEPIIDGKITSVQQLMQIRNNLSGNYTLEADLDLSETEGFVPIGTQAAPFTGTFNGNGHVISNLTLERENNTDTGLFGCIGESGSVSDLTVRNASVKGRIYTGILAGYNQGTIQRCVTSGEVETYAAGGGLAGQNTGRISACHSMGRVSSNGGDSIGGLAGVNSANIGTIDLEKHGIIERSTADVQVTGHTNSGGFIGLNDCGRITDSYAVGAVTGVSFTGGFAGNIVRNYGNNSKSPVEFCYASGNVQGISDAGGFAGYNDGALKQCFATGTVTADRTVGGFSGRNNNKAEVTSCFATGTVTGQENTGLLFGRNYGSYTDSASTAMEGILGNSRRSSVQETAPSLTSADTFGEEGKLNGYTGELWSSLEGILPVLKDSQGRTEGEIVAARSLAQGIYDANKDLEEQEYTAETWKVFKEKRDSLYKTLQNANAGAEDITNAAEDLERAAEGLTERVTDKTLLQSCYDANKNRKQEDYTESGWTAFEKALKEAKVILEDPDATQETVDQAKKALEDAADLLIEKPQGPTEEELCEAIKKAEAAQAAAEQAQKAAEEAKNAADKSREEAMNAVQAAEDAQKQAEEMANASQEEKEAAQEAAKEAAERAKEAAEKTRRAEEALSAAIEAQTKAEQIAEKSRLEAEIFQQELNAFLAETQKAKAEAKKVAEEAEKAYKAAKEAAQRAEAALKALLEEINAVKTGQTYTYKGLKYQVTSAVGKRVSLRGTTNKNSSRITVPSSIQIKGAVYRVTSVAKNAFKGNQKLTRITLGKEIESIGSRAFYKAGKLKYVTIHSTKLKTAGKDALKGIGKKASVNVPNKQIKKYRSLMLKAGMPKETKVK